MTLLASFSGTAAQSRCDHPSSWLAAEAGKRPSQRVPTNA